MRTIKSLPSSTSKTPPITENEYKIIKFDLQSSLEGPKRAKNSLRRVPKGLRIKTREPSRAPEESKGRQSAPPGIPRELFRSLVEPPGT